VLEAQLSVIGVHKGQCAPSVTAITHKNSCNVPIVAAVTWHSARCTDCHWVKKFAIN